MKKLNLPKYQVVKQIPRDLKRFSGPIYREAHSEALNDEKRHFPKKDYDALKKLGNRKDFPKNKLMGKNLASGKIFVAKKAGKVVIPKKYDKEIARHEIVEDKAIARLKKKKK